MMVDGPPRIAAAVMEILLPPNHQAPEALLNHLIESKSLYFLYPGVAPGEINRYLCRPIIYRAAAHL